MFLRVLNTIHEDVVSAEGSGYNPEVRLTRGLISSLPSRSDARAARACHGVRTLCLCARSWRSHARVARRALDTGCRQGPAAASKGTSADARAPLVRTTARQMANRVKDGMRENCMPQIADAWYSILQLHGTAPSLVASCLNTLSQFVSWVDITLVTHERFMRLLVPFMRTPALHEGACGCLTEIV
eukprot:1871772-Prymnesium_polylepis.2